MLLALLLAPIVATREPVIDPREQPLLKRDALFSVPARVSRMVASGDLDGDGRGDLVVARGWRGAGDRGFAAEAIDVRSSKDGRLVRTLWTQRDDAQRLRDWDVGGDVDVDGMPDVVLGLPRAANDHEEAGLVEIRSGRDGRVLRQHRGRGLHDELGSSVAFLGDVDRDGHADYLASAPQITPNEVLLSDPSLATLSPDRAAIWLEVRSRARERFGLVTAWSGRDGSELYAVAGDLAGYGFGLDVVATGDRDGDGACDWIASCAPPWRAPSSWRSGATGMYLERIYEPSGKRLELAGAGDVNADGIADTIELCCEARASECGSVAVRSGRNRLALLSIALPDWMSEYPLACALGDVDGDGHDDIGIGDGNFHLASALSRERDPFTWSSDAPAIESLRRMTLMTAAKIESNPRYSGGWESGCAFVYSGRTRAPIFAAFGDPDSRDGIGLALAPLPDINGDGSPDIAIASGERIYFFAGPGVDVEACPGSVR